MIDEGVTLNGTLEPWPSKQALADILRGAGLSIHVGRFSVSIGNCGHFKFQNYGGDLGDPTISADAETLEALIADGQRVSAALAAADVRHWFEVYDNSSNVVAYL